MAKKRTPEEKQRFEDWKMVRDAYWDLPKKDRGEAEVIAFYSEAQRGKERDE